MTLGLIVWTVFCVAVALLGSEDRKEGLSITSTVRSFGMAGMVWTFGVGTWIGVAWVFLTFG